MYEVVVCFVFWRPIWLPDNNFSLSEWISIKFKHKVDIHKREIGFDFWVYVPNSLGIKGHQKKNFCSFQTITCGMLYWSLWNYTTKGWLGLAFGGYGSNRLGIGGKKRGENKGFLVILMGNYFKCTKLCLNDLPYTAFKLWIKKCCIVLRWLAVNLYLELTVLNMLIKVYLYVNFSHDYVIF